MTTRTEVFYPDRIDVRVHAGNPNPYATIDVTDGSEVSVSIQVHPERLRDLQDTIRRELDRWFRTQQQRDGDPA